MANSAERGGADAHQQVEVVGALARAESLNHRFLFLFLYAQQCVEWHVCAHMDPPPHMAHFFLFLYRQAGVWKGMCVHTSRQIKGLGKGLVSRYSVISCVCTHADIYTP